MIDCVLSEKCGWRLDTNECIMCKGTDEGTCDLPLEEMIGCTWDKSRCMKGNVNPEKKQ